MSSQRSQLYQTINTAARSFALSLRPAKKGTNDLNIPAIRSTLSPSFTVRWGPSRYVSTLPQLQQKLDAEDFLDHLQGMASMWETWTSEISGVTVDEHKKSAVVRCRMVVTSLAGEKMENDMMWVVNMNAKGDKVMWACEYLDVVAIEGMKAKTAATQEAGEQTAALKAKEAEVAALKAKEQEMAASMKDMVEQLAALKAPKGELMPTSKGKQNMPTITVKGLGGSTPPATPIEPAAQPLPIRLF